MQDELNKIDVIRERIGISYREAKEVLDQAEGDLVTALINAEEKRDRGWGDKLAGTGQELAGQVKTYINKGNRTKVKLKRGDQTLVEFPATVGIIGLAAALASTELAIVAGIGAVAALTNQVSFEIEKPDGDTKVISVDQHRENREGNEE